MHVDVGVAGLVTTVLPREVQVESAHNNGSLHLVLKANSSEDLSTNADVSRPWAFLVNVGALHGLKIIDISE